MSVMSHLGTTTTYPRGQALIESDLANATDAPREARITRSVRQTGEKVRVFAARDPADESEFVATEIQRLVHSGKVGSYADVAVMYRANSQAKDVEQALIAAGVPHVLVSAKGLFDRAEVRDVLAYLKLLHNHEDQASLQVPPSAHACVHVRVHLRVHSPSRITGLLCIDLSVMHTCMYGCMCV
jgi:superfamily I DNA/RNA helicase